MADIELVIKIPEELYNRFGHEYSDENLISKYTNDAILDAFCNGTPLPKGHGRLIDADYLREDFKASKRISFAERNVFSNELIDRMSVIRAINDAYDESSDKESYRDKVTHKMMAIPSAEPKTGRWILDETDNSITCDKCGCLIWANDINNGDANYCPNCGARMIEPQERSENVT